MDHVVLSGLCIICSFRPKSGPKSPFPVPHTGSDLACETNQDPGSKKSSTYIAKGVGVERVDLAPRLGTSIPPGAGRPPIATSIRDMYNRPLSVMM